MYSFLAKTPHGDIGVADNKAGDEVFEQLLKEYGNLAVEVRTHEQVFGHGLDYGKPIKIVNIKNILNWSFR
jgi:hypothetical protein